MTAHPRIDAREAQWMAIQRSLSDAIDVAEQMPGGRTVLGEALCAALDTVGGGAPEYAAFGNMRDDARWWADLATPKELEIYAGAALERITRTTFAQRARKRLFMALWRSFTSQEQASFLQKVERPPP